MSEKPTYEELEQRIQVLEKAESEHKRVEEKYRNLIEGIPDLIYSFSTIRGGIYYSPQVHSVLGYSPSYLLQNPKLWHDSIHPEDLDQVDLVISEFQDGKPFEIEYRIRSAKGNWLWLSDRSIGRKQKNGEIIIEGIATDITDRKRSEGALRQSEEKYRLILENIEEGYFEVDLSGNFTFQTSPTHTSDDNYMYKYQQVLTNQ